MQLDLVVVGGGPGGSTLATLVAKTGKKVLLLERERFPRHQIGESLLPMTVHGICPMLGVADELRQQNFPKKTGSTFRWGRRKEIWGFEFGSLQILDQANAGYAYQVEREKFDHILLQNARRHGVDVREQHTALDIISENDRVTGIRYLDDKGQEHSVRARFVADTSGNTSKLSNQVGKRVYSKFFQNVAMYGYFQGAKRLPKPYNWGNILSAAFNEGWFWFIPLSEELTSVGAVIDKKHADMLKADPDTAFRRLVASCPVIEDLLSTGTRVTDGTYGTYRIRKDWSYCATNFWKPGMVILGDAAAFIDPVFSQGVHLATYSALLAARSINTMLDTPGADETKVFDEFERRYRLDFDRFYNFLTVFYDMEQDVDGYYWAARKFNQTEERANDAFISLVSGSASGEFFQRHQDSSRKMQEYTENTSERHFGQAGEFVWTKGRHRMPHELEASKAPLFEGGLIPSVDNLHWTL